MQFKKVISLVVGDYSKDGHEKSSTLLYSIESDIEINAKYWYQIGSAALKFNLLNYCSDYEDSIIPGQDLNPVIKKLIESNIYTEDDFIVEEEDTEYEMDSDSYCDLWIAIMKYGAMLSNLNIKVENFITDEYDIGGYGLFFS